MSRSCRRACATNAEAVLWREYYSVGNDQLDEQHKIILSMVNDLYLALERGNEDKLVSPILDGLCQYTRRHFAREEFLMEIAQYPDLANHKILHERLAQETDRLRSRGSHAGGLSGKEVLTFLKRWWVNHICGADKKYGPFLNRNPELCQ